MITQTELDGMLISAINAEKIEEIQKLISEGADPLGKVKGNITHTDIQAISQMYLFASTDVLDVVLESALEKYQKTGKNILNLGRRVLDDRNCYNFLQDICRTRPEPAYINRVIQYAKKTKQDVKELLNAPMPVFRKRILGTGPDIKIESNLAELLARDLTVADINANLYHIAEYGDSVGRMMGEAWGKWYNSEDEKLSGRWSAFFILFKGNLQTIKCLVEHGLNINPLGDLLPQLIKYSTDLSQWDNFCAETSITLKPTTAPKLDSNGQLEFRATATNRFNRHPQELLVKIDFSELNEFVQNTLKEQKELTPFNEFAASMQNDMTAAQARIASLNTKVEVLTKDMQELQEAVSELAEVQKKRYRKALAEDGNALQLFNHLEGNTKAQLEGGKIAALKIFNAHPSSTTQQHANSAIAVLQFATNSIPIAQNVMACIAFCQQEYAKIQTKKHYANIADKTLGIDAPIVAINVAGHIAGKYLAIKEMLQSRYNNLEWLKNNMWTNVQTATKKLGNMQGNFINHDHLVGYLCANAIQSLNASLQEGCSPDGTGMTRSTANVFGNYSHIPHPGLLPGYAASSTAVSTSTTAMMNMAYSETVNRAGLGYTNDDAGYSRTPPLVFSSKSGKKTPSPKGSDNTIQSAGSEHSSRSSGKKKKAAPSKCSIM